MKIKYLLCFLLFPSLSCFAQLNSIVPLMGINPAMTGLDTLTTVTSYLDVELLKDSENGGSTDYLHIQQTVEESYKLYPKLSLGIGFQMNAFFFRFDQAFNLRPSFSVQRIWDTKTGIRHKFSFGTAILINRFEGNTNLGRLLVYDLSQKIGIAWQRDAREVSFELGIASSLIQYELSRHSFRDMAFGFKRPLFLHANIGLCMSQRTQVSYYAIYSMSKNDGFNQLNLGIQVLTFFNTKRNSNLEFGGGLIRDLFAGESILHWEIGYGKSHFKTIMGVLWNPKPSRFDNRLERIRLSVQLALD